jgi:hypothetical protein
MNAENFVWPERYLAAVNIGSDGDGVHLNRPANDSLAWAAYEANTNENMSTPTREEIDAKLETIEVRMDGRVASIEAKIDGFMARLDERGMRMDERFDRSDERMAGIETTSKETQASIGSLKSTMIVTALSTVLAIVLGVAAFNATVLSNMVASFESGKNTASAQADLKRQAEETAALLKQIQAQLPPAPPSK